MAIVSFEMIAGIEPRGTRRIGTGEIDEQPVGDLDPAPAVGAAIRATAYDPVWGYFTFGQQVGFDTDASFSYISDASFFIEGVFSANAERKLGNIADNATEEDAFTAMASKITALETLFKDAAEAVSPTNYSLWYQSPAADPRVLYLPLPLVDRNGNRICALPASIEVRQSRWPIEISYQATLREAKRPAAKGMLNGTLVDGVTIHIDVASPILHRHRLMGVAGELINVTNYQRVRVAIEGEMTNRVNGGTMVQQSARDLVAILAGNSFSLSAAVAQADGTVDIKTLFPRLYPTQPSVDLTETENSLAFSVQGVE